MPYSLGFVKADFLVNNVPQAVKNKLYGPVEILIPKGI